MVDGFLDRVAERFDDSGLAYAWAKRRPRRRVGRADEIAAVVELLVSERASFVTGIDVLVDSGGLEGLKAMVASG